METAAPSLLEIQRALRACLVAHDDGGISAHVVGAGIGPGERLAIYRNTLASVLTTALRLSYPAVHRLVGADFFECAARSFIERHPPNCACLDDYGAEFPDFLSGFAPASSLPYLPDVARLEWAVSRALHAADAEPLDARRLAALDDTEQGRVTFVPHPSLGFIQVWYPANDIWRAVLEENDAALSAIDPATSRAWMLVQRLPAGVEIRRMSESAWRFTAALSAGRPLAAALAEAGNIDAPALVAEHLAAGRFVDFSLIESIDPQSRWKYHG